MMSQSQINIGSETGPLLLFGGPYSNLQATRALQNKAAQLKISPNRIICTGDMVAYCADPVATLNLLRDWGIHVVMGNCEESLAANHPDCGCGFEAGTACSTLANDWYTYAQQQVTLEQQDWMRGLPHRLDFSWQGTSIAVCHASVDSINQFIFPSTPDAEKLRQLELAGTDVVICGHSGIPFGQKLWHRGWLNTGAIGMPANDGTGSGWYLLLEPRLKGFRASWQRLSYPAELAAATMRQKQLTGGYHETLLSGLWPSLDVLPECERQQQGIALAPAPLDFSS
jgi:predicted phosphodiesterase